MWVPQFRELMLDHVTPGLTKPSMKQEQPRAFLGLNHVCRLEEEVIQRRGEEDFSVVQWLGLQASNAGSSV